jgi:MoCo/4Fe-4S cofactor protein with predicted Tat translocation signal
MLSLAAVREKLASAEGGQVWRSLEEVADQPEFRDMLHREFPRQASEWPQGVSRRGFLELSAASLALAGLTGCTRQPAEQIVPYVQQPEDLVPGKPMFYATALELSGYALGVLVEQHMGRPTKVEGNPEHPASLGATDAIAQAAILSLYDADRLNEPYHLEVITTWGAFVDVVKQRATALASLGGDGLRILTPTITSPTLGAQLLAVLEKYPKACWHRWEPAGRHSARAAAREAFGAYADTRYDFGKADVVVSLDADFLTSGVGSVRYARDFARRRKAWKKGAAAMNRFYMAESAATATAAQADHRLSVAPRGVVGWAAGAAIERGGAGASSVDLSAFGQAAEWVKAAAADLKAHRGRGLVIAGETAPASVHVLAHALNEALGNVGETVVHSEPVEARPEDQVASIQTLADDMRAGRVDTLLILGGNPVLDAPAEAGFRDAMLKVPVRAHCTRTRRRSTANGRSPRPIRSRAGATRAASTAR